MKLPPPEVSNNVVQWLRGATGAKCVLKHFKSDGQKYFAIFNCTVCRDEFKQAADTLSDGIPVKLQEWATKHAHQPPAIEDVLATVFEPGNFKKRLRLRSLNQPNRLSRNRCPCWCSTREGNSVNSLHDALVAVHPTAMPKEFFKWKRQQ